MVGTALHWRAVVSALDAAERLRSRLSAFQHPLAGRPTVWHVVRALLDVTPPPDDIVIVHDARVPLALGDDALPITFVPAPPDGHAAALRAALAGDATRGATAVDAADARVLLVDGAAPLLLPATVGRLLSAAATTTSAIVDADGPSLLALAGTGVALAARTAPLAGLCGAQALDVPTEERLRVVDRHRLSAAGLVVRDRLVRGHEARGVSFLLPATTWVDVDVRIAPDTLVYPGCVLEGATRIGSECVIGPHARLVDAIIGRGAELKGWNYVSHVSIRNHAVLEPHERRGID